MATQSPYRLGPVKIHVAATAIFIGNRFDLDTIYGFANRDIAGTSTISDHAKGLALDFMCDRAKGDGISAYLKDNAAEHNVKYIIWSRRIWSVARASEGWRSYRGLNPHTDHVHVSFTDTGSGSVINPGGIVKDLGPFKEIKAINDSLSGLVAAMGYLANPANWVRVWTFAAGVILILVGIIRLNSKASKVVSGAGKAVTDAAKP